MIGPTPEMRAWDRLRRPIWLFDPHNLRGVYANVPALALWGAESLDELLARDFSQLSTAVTTRTRRLAAETANGEEVTEQWTFYPNGQPVTVQAIISTYALPDGRPVLLFEAAPIEVQAGERRAVEALRNTSTIITLFDGEGKAVFANPAAFAAYGATELPFMARFADGKAGAAILARVAKSEASMALCEAQTVGGRRWHQMDAHTVTDPVTGAPGILLNELDVTDRVEAERKAATAEARRKFLSDMSHELRTPLNAVVGFSELLQGADLSREQHDQAERINQAGRALTALVNEMIGHADQPAEPPAPQPYSGALEWSAAETAGADTPRVLYVDDNDSNRRLISTILTAQGVYCETADDGVEGVAAAKRGRWSLILMDIQMPRMDGIEATRLIRALPGPAALVPIVAVTANTLPDQLADYENAGMNDCIAKPVGIADLLARVRYWTEEQRLENKASAA